MANLSGLEAHWDVFRTKSNFWKQAHNFEALLIKKKNHCAIIFPSVTTNFWSYVNYEAPYVSSLTLSNESDLLFRNLFDDFQV